MRTQIDLYAEKQTQKIDAKSQLGSRRLEMSPAELMYGFVVSQVYSFTVSEVQKWMHRANGASKVAQEKA